MGHVESMNMTASAEQHPAQWQSSQQHEEIRIAYLSRWRNETIYLLVHGEASNTKLHFALFAATLLNRVENICERLESVFADEFSFNEYIDFRSEDTVLPSQGYIRAKLNLHCEIDLLNNHELQILIPASALTEIDFTQLTEDEITWHPVDVSLRISNIDLSKEDKQRLSINSLLLIPESFKPHWRCAIEIPGSKAVIRSKYNRTTQQICTENPHLPAHVNRFLQIYISRKIPMDPAALSNKNNEQSIALFDPDYTDECFCVCSDGRQYDARLLSVGDGFAVRLNLHYS